MSLFRKLRSPLGYQTLTNTASTPTLSNKSIFDNPPGYQSLLPENNATLSKTSNALTNTSTDLLSGGLKGSLTSNFSTLNNPSNSSFSNESSLFSTSSPYQNNPLWEQLNSYSDEELSELTDMMNQAKEEERLYGNSPTKQSLLNRFFGIKQAHAGTLSSQGIENKAISMPSDEALSKALSRHIPALKAYEGEKDKIYIDSNNYATIGIGTRLMPHRVREGFFEEYIPESEKEKLITALTLTEDLFKSGKMKDYYEYEEQQKLFERISNGEDIPNLNLRPAEKAAISYIYQYNMNDEQKNRFVQKHYQEEAFDKLRKFLKYKNIDYSKLPDGMQEILLDIAYNAGVSSPLYIKIKNKDGSFTEKSYWNKLGDYLAAGNYYKALSEIYRNVQDSRNNYLFLRGMQDHGYLSGANIINIAEQLAQEDKIAEKQGKSKRGRINNDNYDYYQKLFNLPVISPF